MIVLRCYTIVRSGRYSCWRDKNRCKVLAFVDRTQNILLTFFLLNKISKIKSRTLRTKLGLSNLDLNERNSSVVNFKKAGFRKSARRVRKIYIFEHCRLKLNGKSSSPISISLTQKFQSWKTKTVDYKRNGLNIFRIWNFQYFYTFQQSWNFSDH